MSNSYDSTKDTLLHIRRVSQLLNDAASMFVQRANVHDASKLVSPEKELFDEYTPLLANTKYGSPEYDGFLEKLRPALLHHYQNNTHHPEHYENGISGMDLFDLVEMFFDWKAASERTAEGSIYRSLEINEKRFEIDKQIIDIFNNTAKRLGY
jgi:hypothetical protein